MTGDVKVLEKTIERLQDRQETLQQRIGDTRHFLREGLPQMVNHAVAHMRHLERQYDQLLTQEKELRQKLQDLEADQPCFLGESE